MAISPNRVASYLTAGAGLATALAPAVAELDTSSTVTLVAGVGVIFGVFSRWLTGWQKHEARKDDAAATAKDADSDHTDAQDPEKYPVDVPEGFDAGPLDDAPPEPDVEHPVTPPGLKPTDT